MLELTDQQLSDVLVIMMTSRKKSRVASRAVEQAIKGFLVLTEDGLETNLGHVCGTKVFGIAFENLATDLEKRQISTDI